MKKITPVFINTQNVRNFGVMMGGLAMAEGEGCLGMVYGRAGRGKTRTCQWYAANKNCIYLRMLKVWRTSELDFLQTLARELGVLKPPHRKGPCFAEITDALLRRPRAVFVDEIEKLPPYFLEVVRDLTDMSGAPFILVGEEELVSVMRRNRRVWSRTYQQIEFAPIARDDIIRYAKDAADLAISSEVSHILHQSSEGDWRIVRRDMLALVQNMNAAGATDVTPKIANISVKAGLSGR